MKANAFEDADIPVLWAFADQAAIALSNAYIIEELSSQKEKLETAQRELMMVQKELQDDLVKTRLEEPPLTAKGMRLEGPMAKVGVVTDLRRCFILHRWWTKSQIHHYRSQSPENQVQEKNLLHALSTRGPRVLALDISSHSIVVL